MEWVFLKGNAMIHELVLLAAFFGLTVILFFRVHGMNFQVLRGRLSGGAFDALRYIVFRLWEISLVVFVLGKLTYLFGIAWLDYALPLPLWARWVGIAIMAGCYPLALPERRQRLRLSQHAVLALCGIGMVIASANAFILATTLAVVVLILPRVLGKGRSRNAFKPSLR